MGPGPHGRGVLVGPGPHGRGVLVGPGPHGRGVGESLWAQDPMVGEYPCGPRTPW